MRLSWLALALPLAGALPAAAATVTWTGTITCRLDYAGGGFSLHEVQTWVLGKVSKRAPPRVIYSVLWRDRGTMTEPAGTWSVAAPNTSLTLDFTSRPDGSTAVDRNVISGFSPPGVEWVGPHPFRAIEFDFLAISIPKGVRHLQGSKQQVTTPPSYYQFLKTTPGKSVCSWTFDRA